ncbi:LTE1 [Candida pseudojiufengensis]|uniref:LTE1 n=1 Tax=Candida pseudojiufengensis TaxID=497109 RepID=UPI0022257AB8|nr:LTE1 [Candida pseudojiufengensis]KAI5966171.1 LTE1 [Candida pseudojiufengensis]
MVNNSSNEELNLISDAQQQIEEQSSKQDIPSDEDFHSINNVSHPSSPQLNNSNNESKLPSNTIYSNKLQSDLDVSTTATLSKNNLTKSISDMGIYQQHIPSNYQYNKHDESIFDDEKLFPCLPTSNIHEDLVKFDEKNSELINNATIKALIVQMTSPEVIDYNLICDFFLTYRMFSNGYDIMKLLMTRLIWSLQYISSGTEFNIKIGKLVLLRTFVVLRHWIINYFVDDFNNNYQLCDLFSNTINDLINESNLIREKNNDNYFFITKIFGDLKTHWLNLINEFWSLNIDLESITNKYPYSLPLAKDLNNCKKLSKCNTEMSIHTNPSYRRSAMLSLYDQKIHYKTLIFNDDSHEEENPQYSINNLLLQHQSSRLSINNKIHEIQQQQKKLTKSPTFSTSFISKSSPAITYGGGNMSQTPTTSIKNAPKKNKRALAQSTRHNRMDIKDSALELKKTKAISIDNEDEEEKENSDVIRTPKKSGKHDTIGFSTNGNIKLPTSKVTKIVPPTPVKKMECNILNDEFNSPSRKNSFQPPTTESLNDYEFARKKSIKKLMEGWKKSLVAHSRESLFDIPYSHKSLSAKPSSENLNHLVNNAINVKSEIGNRVDVLSARIVDELEYLIRYYISDSNSNSIIHEIDGHYVDENGDEFVDVPESRPIDKEVDLKPIDVSPNNESDVDINDLSELNIIKIDNLINEKEDAIQTIKVQRNLSENILDEVNNSAESFQKPASINWNDEDVVDLEASTEKIENTPPPLGEEDEYDEFNFTKESGSGGSNVIYNEPNFNFQQSNQSLDTSTISTPSNFTQYDAEITDLGIALSPQSGKPKRISFCEKTNNNINNKRLSILSKGSAMSVMKRDSMKSYLSYDSAFSITNDSNSFKNHITMNDNGLKKKTGFNNLQDIQKINSNQEELKGAIKLRSSSHSSRKSSKKSVRYSTLYALIELPFNEADIFNDDRRASVASYPEVHNNSSIFSIALRSKNSLNRKDQLSAAITGSSNNSVAIPGISNYALKELAAIPDESMQSAEDPIEFALHKLEGKYPSKATLKKKDTDDDQNSNVEDEKIKIDDTEDILNQINNAHTEDAINMTTFENLSDDTPLTPIKTKTKQNDSFIERSTSTPESNYKISNLFEFQPHQQKFNSSIEEYQSPKIILDGYSPSSDLLSVQNIIQNKSHISFVLSYDSKTLANHFTIIEKDMLQEIDWKDLIELKWQKELTPVNSWLEIIVNDDYYIKNKGVNLVISRFNLMVNWIISEILLTSNSLEKMNIISRFIHIAQNCLILQNFSTLMQIILALTSNKIQNLKTIWRNLSPGDILLLKNLELLTSPIKNFLNLRIAINSIKSSKGCIPFVGLYLSDLTFNAERPSIIKRNITQENDENSNSNKLINFSKFRTSVHIVKSLSQCIEWSINYNLKIENEILSKCLYIQSLDEDEMRICIESNV